MKLIKAFAPPWKGMRWNDEMATSRDSHGFTKIGNWSRPHLVHLVSEAWLVEAFIGKPKRSGDVMAGRCCGSVAYRLIGGAISPLVGIDSAPAS